MSVVGISLVDHCSGGISGSLDLPLTLTKNCSAESMYPLNLRGKLTLKSKTKYPARNFVSMFSSLDKKSF